MAGGETRDLEDKFQDLSRSSRLNAKEKNIICFAEIAVNDLSYEFIILELNNISSIYMYTCKNITYRLYSLCLLSYESTIATPPALLSWFFNRFSLSKRPPSVSPRSGYMVSANIHARVDQLLLFGDGHPTFDDGNPNVLVSIHIGSMGLSPMMKV